MLACAGQDVRAKEQAVSPTHTGLIGLNTVPSARMDEQGTVRAGISHLDPHNHAFIGFQIAKPLYINLRQSMMVSSAGQKPDTVYPGMDFKLRLRQEGRYAPEMVFGMDSALGHRRFSSEYFALSKRVYDFDFTAGVAWGRLGSAGHLKNPLSALSSHFGEDRDHSSENASSPADWFTGEEIGFFGGVEYYTPIEGLSLKADFNADAYSAESRYFGFEKPSPWSVGLNYTPRDFVSIGASVVGLDKIMARLSFQGDLFSWPGASHKKTEPVPLRSDRPLHTAEHFAWGAENTDGFSFGQTRVHGRDFSGVVHLDDSRPAALQIGRAARHLAANAGPDIETITVIPVSSGLRAKAVRFSRRDLESAIVHKQGSPEEIWQDTSFSHKDETLSRGERRTKYKFFPELSFALAEEETTHLYRASLTGERTDEWAYGFRTGGALRLNVADNLHRLAKFRDINLQSIRADADLFTANRVNLDRSYLSWMRTVLPDLHVAATAGYLEEMYAGYGGEILYRPFDSPFAIGAEGWKVMKRDGASALALGLTGQEYFTGHVNFYYDIPDTDITAFAKAGKFIGGDIGMSGGAQMNLADGLNAKAFVTVSDSGDKDVFGSDRNIIGGLQLSMPLGNMKFIPEGSAARVSIAPIGRDDGAVLDKPLSLYDVTEPTTYRRLGRSWQEVLN